MIKSWWKLHSCKNNYSVPALLLSPVQKLVTQTSVRSAFVATIITVKWHSDHHHFTFADAGRSGQRQRPRQGSWAYRSTGHAKHVPSEFQSQKQYSALSHEAAVWIVITVSRILVPTIRTTGLHLAWDAFVLLWDQSSAKMSKTFRVQQNLLCGRPDRQRSSAIDTAGRSTAVQEGLPVISRKQAQEP